MQEHSTVAHSRLHTQNPSTKLTCGQTLSAPTRPSPGESSSAQARQMYSQSADKYMLRMLLPSHHPAPGTWYGKEARSSICDIMTNMACSSAPLLSIPPHTTPTRHGPLSRSNAAKTSVTLSLLVLKSHEAINPPDLLKEVPHCCADRGPHPLSPKYPHPESQTSFAIHSELPSLPSLCRARASA